MKKIFALVIALFMIATLVACADKDDTGNPLETLGAGDNGFSNNNVGTFKYEVGDDGHYTITGYLVNVASSHAVEIPKEIDGITVTAIAPQAFRSATSITSVTIPDSVKSIGDFAFYDCDKLKTITIANSVEEIGVGAFRDCAVLNNVTLPSSLTKISDELFWDCPSLSSISTTANITVIGKGAFYNCDAFTNIKIPSTVTEVQEIAFYGCDNLRSITIPESIVKIGVGAFSDITADKVTFTTKTGSYFATYFEATYGVNETDYSHYELVLN